MSAGTAHDGMPRLLLAVAVSLALHAAIIVSVSRQAGSGDGIGAGATATQPLIARLAAVVSESVTSVPVTPESPAAIPEAAPLVTAAPAASNAGGERGGGDNGIYYFKSSELDRRPFPLVRIEVPAPESSAAQSGAVMLRLRISESGRVDDAKIVMGTGIPEFEEAALREFAGARFHPGYRANLPVRSEMLIEVTLRPPPGNASQGALPAVAGSRETRP